MLTLCGFPASNYYNKVKLALLEKGVAFEEEGLEAFLAYRARLASEPPQARATGTA